MVGVASLLGLLELAFFFFFMRLRTVLVAVLTLEEEDVGDDWVLIMGDLVSFVIARCHFSPDITARSLQGHCKVTDANDGRGECTKVFLVICVVCIHVFAQP